MPYRQRRIDPATVDLAPSTPPPDADSRGTVA